MSSFIAGQVLTASQLNTEFAAISGTPIGGITMWAGATTSLPTGYVMCDGSSYATTGTYANLYAVIGYRYGGSAGTFYVPKLNANYLPIGTSTANADGSRQTTVPSIVLYTSTTTSGGHSHTYNFTLNNHASSGHTHTYNAPGTGGTDHSHSGTTNPDGVNSHTHQYFKPNTGGNNVTFAPMNTHTHGFGTGNASAFNHNHNAGTTLTTNADTGHAHTVASGTWSTTADTGHFHYVNASYVVFIIRYS